LYNFFFIDEDMVSSFNLLITLDIFLEGVLYKCESDYTLFGSIEELDLDIDLLKFEFIQLFCVDDYWKVEKEPLMIGTLKFIIGIQN
jgi:hypothetical protein